MITSTNPRTGEARPSGLEPTTAEGVAATVEQSAAAFDAFRRRGRMWRADVLASAADALEADRSSLVDTAMWETGLSRARLEGEITRSAFQFRLFGEAIREGGYLEAMIDRAGPTPMGVAPDVRRMLVPIGPVAVFGSSNFPFAFSVAGGDTASALAAGNPVIVKAHSSHPETSWLSFHVLRAALEANDAPAGSLGIVFGQEAGSVLVADERIRAVGFTGSRSTGERLLEIIARRGRPIPFFGELSSVNPLIVSVGAARDRSREIADGLFAAVTGSGGQLCTKPGIAFVPRSATALVDEVVARVTAEPAHTALNERIAQSFGDVSRRLVSDGRARVLAHGAMDGAGLVTVATVLGVDAADMTPAVTEEAFGPLVVLAFYDDVADIARGLDSIPDSLAAAVHTTPEERSLRLALLDQVFARVGRVVFDGFPTGVRVGWAQHHGGPWPATNTQHTSVGVTAIRRFLRPLAFQDGPEDVLPPELADGTPIVPRRVDGRLVLPGSAQ